VKSIYQRISYLLFRLFYTSSHWLFFKLIPACTDQPQQNGRYILVCGIEASDHYSIEKLQLFVKLCARHYPKKQVVLLSKLKINTASLVKGLRVVQWDYQERARSLGHLARILYRQGSFDEVEVQNTASNACAMVDLGHHQVDGTKATGFTANFLANVVFAKRFHLPYYCLSQSFGPICYPIPLRFTLQPMLRSFLPSLAWVGARDQVSLDTLKAIGPMIAGELSPEFLLYADKVVTTSAGSILSLRLIADTQLLGKPNALSEVLCWCDAQTERHGVKNRELFAYDEPDCLVAAALDLPTHWTLTTQAQLSEPISVTTPDSITITNKYHSAIASILEGQPAIYWQPEHAIQFLYEKLGIGALLANDQDSLDKAMEIRCNEDNYNKLQSAMHMQLATIQYQINPFFKALDQQA